GRGPIPGLRRLRWHHISALTVIGAIIGLWLLDRGIEQALKIPIDNYLRGRTLALVQSTEKPSVTIALPSLSLSLFRRRVELKDVRIRYDKRDSVNIQLFEGYAPSIVLTGVDLSDVIWRRKFRLSGVTIENPVIRHLQEGPADTSKTKKKTPTLKKID